MSKYYTPKISEFYVGFEYERFVTKRNTSEEDCWDKINMSVNYLILDEIDDEIIVGDIRVKYLDKDDIESLGFKEESNNFFKLRDSEYISLDSFVEDKGWFLTYGEEEDHYGFSGWLKNKSELKILLKKLG